MKVRLNPEVRLKLLTVILPLKMQLAPLPASNTAISEVPGTEAGAPPPDDVPQLAVLVQDVEAPPTQYRVAAPERILKNKNAIRNSLCHFIVN